MYARLAPVIRAVARQFVGSSAALVQEGFGLEDLESLVWVQLLENDRALLNKWEPDRGGIDGYVRMKARYLMVDRLRVILRRQAAAPQVRDVPDGRVDEVTPEDEAESAELGRKIDRCVRAQLGNRPRHLRVYELEFVDRHPPEEVQERIGIESNVLYRLRFDVKQVLEQCYRKAIGKSEDLPRTGRTG